MDDVAAAASMPPPPPRGHLQARANAHVWAHVFAWLDNAASTSQLRATCTRAVVGFDVATHSGNIPIAGHDPAAADEDGATCRWVNGWFPVSPGSWIDRATAAALTTGGHHVTCGHQPAAPSPSFPLSRIALRLEHRLEHGLASIAAFPLRVVRPGHEPLTDLLVCETLASAPAAPSQTPAAAETTALNLAYVAATHISIVATATTGGGSTTRGDITHLSSTMAARNPCRCHSVTLDVKRATSITSIDVGVCPNLEHLSLPPSLATLARDCFAESRLCSFDSTGLTNLTSVGGNFLYQSLFLRHVNLDGFTNVTAIQNRFLARCEAMEAIDLSPLSSVTSIAADFLADSGALRRVNVSGLRNVGTIGERFISHMASLETLDLSPMVNVFFIGADFISQNPSLRRVDIGGFRHSVTALLRGAFAGCPALRCLDTGGLASVVNAQRFGEGVHGVKSIDLGHMRALTEIPALCMSDALDVRTVKTAGLAAGDRSGGAITTIGDYAFYHMPALTSIDLTGFAHVTDVGNGCVSRCAKLTEFSTAGGLLPQVRIIGNGVLSECASLVRFDAAGLGAVVSIGHQFLAGNASLTSVSFVGFAQLQRIGRACLADCRLLEALDTAGLDSVESVGTHFGFRCSHLATVDTCGLGGLTGCGGFLFAECPRLRIFEGSNLGNLTELGDHAFGPAPSPSQAGGNSGGPLITLPKLPEQQIRLPG